MRRIPLYRDAGYVWLITHRCHGNAERLRYLKDRERYLYWAREARRNHGLCVLNYTITRDHIHLLVLDQKRGEIPRSLSAIAMATARDYRARGYSAKPFWEERYQVTAIDDGTHLLHCLAYLDLNMVRHGRVDHPRRWSTCGYHEIVGRPSRYRVINMIALMDLLRFRTSQDLRAFYRNWIETIVAADPGAKEPRWCNSLAVGRKGFIDLVRERYGGHSPDCGLTPSHNRFILREPFQPYRHAHSALPDLTIPMHAWSTDNTLPLPALSGPPRATY